MRMEKNCKSQGVISREKNQDMIRINAVEFNLVASGEAFYIKSKTMRYVEPSTINPLERIALRDQSKYEIGLIFHEFSDLQAATNELKHLSSGKWLVFEQGIRTPYGDYSRVYSYKAFGELESRISKVIPNLVDRNSYGVHKICGGIQLKKFV